MSRIDYAADPDQQFWREHWAHTPRVPIDETSPLTRLIRGALPRRGRVLDVGCGQGQLVEALRTWNYDTIGIDWAFGGFDGRHLPFASRTFGAYIALGVWEHDPDGPSAFAHEAARVLASGGTLIVSVPYLNVLRRWQQDRAGAFYQHVFSRREFCAYVEAAGFHVTRTAWYSVGYALAKRVPAARRRRWRWLRRMPGLTALTAHMLLVVATRGTDAP